MKDDNPSLDGTHTGRLKRKIPAVTEVLDELASRLKTDPYGKGQLFDAAQRVCTEEIRRLKLEGGEPASLWLLVERARDLLDPSRRSRGESAAVSAIPFDEEPFDLTAPPAPNPNFVLPRPGEADAIVFEPPPPAPPRPAPRPTWGREIAEPPAISTPRPSRAAAPPRFTHAPQRHSALRVFFLVVAAGALLGGGYYSYRLRERRAAPPAASRSKPARQRIVAPAPAAPTVSASPSAAVAAPPSPVPRPASAAVARPEAARAAPETSSRQVEAPSQSRPGTMASAEWAGKPAVYMLHFSSYKSRENANRDAGRLSARLGQPAHVLQVDLGGEGIWYRVMVGEFPTAEEAFAFRAELASRKTPDVGLVFKVTGPSRQ